jgi:uncharacterized damage-inducible protein DinB
VSAVVSAVVARPEAGEYTPYYGTYVGKVPDGDVRELLRSQLPKTIELISSFSEEKASVGYGPGKWTLKEVLLHIADAERVFSYRMLRIGRGDTTPLPGFDQDPWVLTSHANDRSLPSLLAEYQAVRAATQALVDSLSAEAWLRKGTASDHPISARALGYICAGHELHHVQLIRERYV